MEMSFELNLSNCLIKKYVNSGKPRWILNTVTFFALVNEIFVFEIFLCSRYIEGYIDKQPY